LHGREVFDSNYQLSQVSTSTCLLLTNPASSTRGGKQLSKRTGGQLTRQTLRRQLPRFVLSGKRERIRFCSEEALRKY